MDTVTHKIDKKQEVLLFYASSTPRPVRAALQELLDEVLGGLSGFSRYEVRCEDGSIFSAASYNTVSLPGVARSYDPRLRPAVTLLRQLGRKRHEVSVLHGLPDVALAKPLAELAAERGDDEVVINAATMSETLESMTPYPTGCSGESDPAVVFGPGEFRITIDTLSKLEESCRVVCDPNFCPPQFYTELCKLTTVHVPYYSVRRTQALARIGTHDAFEEIQQLLKCSIERVKVHLGAVRKKQPHLPTFEATTPNEARAWDNWMQEFDKYNSRLEQHTDALANLANPDVDSLHSAFVQRVRDDPQSFGFTSPKHAEQVLGYSLNELSSAVCISQEGYFLTDGSNGRGNQLCSIQPTPIVFLSAAGIDFCTEVSTVIESLKYFTENPEWSVHDKLNTRFLWWKESGRSQFYERVHSLYSCIFRAAQIQGVKYPCMLPMGLGVFLDNAPEHCREEMKKCYFEAQLRLLETDFGFAAYLINVGAPAHVKLIQEVIDVGRYYLKCPVVVHSRDVKYVAVSLARAGMRAGYLNPSDAIATMQ
eukprot:Sspe_Gene.20549::Locus_7553_Transcript_1_1_Confidence_1.000_Length_1726::g.20549::m.20549